VGKWATLMWAGTWLAVRQVLPPELQAFASAITKASAVLVDKNKVEQQTAQTAIAQTTRNENIGTMVEEMDADIPGWQEHQEDMIELLDFLESRDLTSKRWGSKGKLLHSIVTGNAKAVNEAAGRMRSAVRHKGVKPQSSRGPETITERIVKAKTEDETWDLITKDALEKFPNLPD